jgi:hypothetical protein
LNCISLIFCFSFLPTFFIQTHWDKIQQVTLSFRIKQGNEETHTFRIKKPSQRWSLPTKRYKRHVFIQDISRTLPLDATAGYAKIARSTAGEISTDSMSDDFTKRLSHILSRNYSNARFVQAVQQVYGKLWLINGAKPV